MFESKPLTSMLSPEWLSLTLTFERMIFEIPKMLFWPYFLVSPRPWSLTFWFQSLISSSESQLSLSSKFPLNFHKRYARYPVHKLLAYDHAQMDAQTAQQQMPSATNCWWRHKNITYIIIVLSQLNTEIFKQMLNYQSSSYSTNCNNSWCF